MDAGSFPGGYSALPHAVAEDTELSDGAYRVYGALLRLAAGRGECRPTNRQLAEMTGGRSAEACLSALKCLHDRGLIRVEYEAGGRVRNRVLIPPPFGVPLQKGTLFQRKGSAPEGYPVSAEPFPVSAEPFPVSAEPGYPVLAEGFRSNGEPLPRSSGTLVLSLNNSEEYTPRAPAYAGSCEGPEAAAPGETIRNLQADVPAEAIAVPLATVNGPDDRPRALDAVANDPEEVDRVARLAEELFPGACFDGQVRSYRGCWPMAWMRRALEDARAWSSPPRTFQPIVNRLRKWASDGGPPPDAPSAAVSSAPARPYRSAEAPASIPPVYRGRPEGAYKTYANQPRPEPGPRRRSYDA